MGDVFRGALLVVLFLCTICTTGCTDTATAIRELSDELRYARSDGLRRIALEHVLNARYVLTYRANGADYSVASLRSWTIDTLRKQYGLKPGTIVKLNCDTRGLLFVPVQGYHWCEISAPPQYPKRLVVAAMDDEGHADIFFSNYSQAATER